MDAYFFDYGMHRDYPRHEEERECGIVVAPTRGKAKALAYSTTGWNVEWNDLRHLRKLCGGVKGPARVVEYGDPEEARLWRLAEDLLSTDALQLEEGQVCTGVR